MTRGWVAAALLRLPVCAISPSTTIPVLQTVSGSPIPPKVPRRPFTAIGVTQFQITNVFNIDGAGNHISDSDSWHETQDVYLLINDATNTTAINGFYSRDCRLLFNGALATYPNQIALKVNNAAGKIMLLHHFNFHSITWFTNQVVTYPMSITLGNATSEITPASAGTVLSKGRQRAA